MDKKNKRNKNNRNMNIARERNENRPSPNRTARINTERQRARAANSSRHKRKRKRNLMRYYILLALFIIVTGITLSVTVFFNVENITLNESVYYNRDDILETANVKEGDNLFRISEKKIEEKIISGYIYIDKVEVKKKIPSGLFIQITDAKVNFNIEYSENKYAYISENGRILEILMTEPFEEYVTITGLNEENYNRGEYLEKSFKYTVFEKITEALNETNLSDIGVIDLTDTSNIVITYQDRLRIELGDSTELQYKIRGISQLIDSEIYENEKGRIIYIKSGTNNHFNFIPSGDENEEEIQEENGVDSQTESHTESIDELN